MSNPYDPYNQNQWNNPGNPYGMPPGYPPMVPQKQQLPNSTLILIFGIVSIVFSFCYGVIGVALGITALIISKRGKQMYEQNPALYDQGSYNNLNAGRICATIGLIVGSLVLILVILYFIFIFTVISSAFDGMMLTQ